MAHPAASIKSIFSGKVNFTDTDFDDYSTKSFSESYLNLPESDYDYSTPEFTKPPQPETGEIHNLKHKHKPRHKHSDSDAKNPPDAFAADDASVLLKNLRLAALQKGHDFYPLQSSSTNVSLASSGSDYQQTYMRDIGYTSDSSQAEPGFSRPWSRNSNTSCLSTTATKDGIEGKRHHRYVPFPFVAPRAVHSEDVEQLGPPVTLKEKIGLLSPEPRPPH